MNVSFEGQKIKLNLADLDNLQDLDVEDLIKIDYANIVGELLTFPVILNRIGLFLSEQEELLALTQLDTDILYSKLSEEKRRMLTEIIDEPDAKGNKKKKINKPTAPEVENAVKLDARYKAQTEELLLQQKYFKRLQSIYTAAKSKDKKLETLYLKVTPKEHEEDVIEGKFNGIAIKSQKKLIPDPPGYNGRSR